MLKIAHATGVPAAPRAHPRLLSGSACALMLLAAGCGGGGGGDGGNTAPPPPSALCTQAGTPQATYAKSGATVGQPGAVTIAGCDGALSSPQWAQTGGPALAEWQADKSQTASFMGSAAGRYTFRVDYRDAQGTARQQELAVDVAAAASATQLALRNSHSVRMGGAVSVRAWPQLQGDEALQSITWQQLEGPAVTLNVDDPYRALFTAPTVSQDTLIRLRATLTTTRGRSASDEALVLVERHAQADANDRYALWSGSHVSRVHPFRAGGPHAAALVRCAYDAAMRDDGLTSNLCPLSTLPFLAQSSGGALPTIDQVMDRVLVSHDWAGRNFERFLRDHDGNGDFRRMLMSVTAIVIGAQVRPSFYHPGTGAIYLDADNFWLLPEERDTINEAPDFRSDFGNALQYATLWRYVRGSNNIFRYFDPRQRVARDTGALLDEAGWLLFHELAHALDFMPPGAYATLDNGRTAWGNMAARVGAGQLTSDVVQASYPLTSTLLSGLGQVRFFGATADAAQRAITPAQVAAAFGADLATDDYAYSTAREDTAMALEEFLMSRRLGLRRDFAITPAITPGVTGATLAVQWGQRGRVGDAALRPRLRLIVQRLAPWLDAAEVDALAPPIAMRAGDSWDANLSLPAPLPPVAPAPLAAKPAPTLQDLWLLEKAERRRAPRAAPGTAWHAAMPARR